MNPSDQAAGLRSPASLDAGWRLPALAVTGGKGGVGKTCLAVNLAVELARQGLKPLLVDLDLGLANADILLGVDPTRTLADVLDGRARIEDCVTKSRLGVDLVAAASGRDDLARLGPGQIDRLLQRLGSLAEGYDLLVLDGAAGLGREVMHALRAARSVCCVVTPDPTSIADAYALVKVLEGQAPGRDVRLLVNLARDHQEATAVATRLRQVAATYLKRDLPLLGWLPQDRAVADSVRQRRTFAGGDSLAASALRGIALRLKGERWKG